MKKPDKKPSAPARSRTRTATRRVTPPAPKVVADQTPPEVPVELPANHGAFSALPPQPPVGEMVDSFEAFLAKAQTGTVKSFDDIYRGIRIVGVTPSYERFRANPATQSPNLKLYGWCVYGKPLLPDVVIPRTTTEVKSLLERCGDATFLPSVFTNHYVSSGYCETVVHLPEKGESVVIRVPRELFILLPVEVRFKLLASDLRTRLAGKYVTRWQEGDPEMFRPLPGDRRYRVGVMSTEADLYSSLYPSTTGGEVPKPPAWASSVYRRDPMDWIKDPAAPEHEMMRWELTLFELFQDLGAQPVLKILRENAKQHGWSRTLLTEDNLRGFGRWLDRQERQFVSKLLKVRPGLKGAAKDVSAVLGATRTVIDKVRGFTDRVANAR